MYPVLFCWSCRHQLAGLALLCVVVSNKKTVWQEEVSLFIPTSKYQLWWYYSSSQGSPFCLALLNHRGNICKEDHFFFLSFFWLDYRLPNRERRRKKKSSTYRQLSKNLCFIYLFIRRELKFIWDGSWVFLWKTAFSSYIDK